MSETMRADVALAARGMAESRQKARALIESGLVTANGRPVTKPAQPVSELDILTVLGDACPWVGRGGLKLEKALKVFGVDPTGQVCMDIGASTGGFTDVLLRGGAAKVYAIDSGTGQLHPSLRDDARVVNMERVNARALSRNMFDPLPTLAVMDVSFISIKLILPAAFDVLGDLGRMIALVKPQFEAGRARVGKGGIVSSAAVHGDVLREIVAFAPTLGWAVRGLDFSPIAGGSGNIEFLIDLLPAARCDRAVDDGEIQSVVRRAHQTVKG